MREYIGARYVPKFFENSATGDNSWARSTAYEAMTIVTYNNNTYISKKAVPPAIGQPNTAHEYWLLLGNFNSQLNEVIERLNSLSDTVEDNTNDITSLEDDVTALQSIVGNRKSLSNIICLTDSYGTDSGTERISWCTYLQEMLGLTTGVNFRKLYAAGASFGDDDNTKNLYNIFVSGTTGMTTTEKAEISDIIIESGVNEWNEDQTIMATNMGLLDTYIRANFPNAKIWLFWCGFDKRPDVRIGCFGGATPASEKYMALSASLNWSYFENISAMVNKNNYADNVHPNPDGSKLIAKIIYNSIKGAPIVYNKFHQYNINITTSSNTRVMGYIYYDGNNYIVTPKVFSCDAIGDLAGGFNSEVKLGEISTNLIIGGNDDSYLTYTRAKLGVRVDSAWQEIEGTVCFKYENDTINMYFRNNGDFVTIPTPAISNITDTYIIIDSFVLPVWD